MKHRTTFETKIDALYGETVFDEDEFEVPVELELELDGDEFEIVSITRLDNGAQIIPTTDILQDLNENVVEELGFIQEDAEAAYTDYRYEQYRDERELEL